MRRLAAIGCVLALSYAPSAGPADAEPASSSRAGVAAKRVLAGTCARQRTKAAKRARSRRRACTPPPRRRRAPRPVERKPATTAPAPVPARPATAAPGAAPLLPVGLAPTLPAPAVSAVTGAPPPPAPVASTLGVDAYDFGSFVLRLSRLSVPAGSLTIYFRNNDSSDHNLWLDPPAPGGRSELISDVVGEGGGATRVVTVTAGAWRLYCSLLGHGSMSQTLTVG